jgi:hypothetical protein
VTTDDLFDLIATAFEPVMALLDNADLTELPVEPDLDPGRAPRPRDLGAGAA